jgi:hypothetical protein
VDSSNRFSIRSSVINRWNRAVSLREAAKVLGVKHTTIQRDLAQNVPKGDTNSTTHGPDKIAKWDDVASGATAEGGSKTLGRTSNHASVLAGRKRAGKWTNFVHPRPRQNRPGEANGARMGFQF